MEQQLKFRGMATVSFYADDMQAARKWYTQVLDTVPYFQMPDAENPVYVEFRIGDYHQELGIIDKKYMPEAGKSEPGGAILYWHVDDLQNTFDHLLKMGATIYEPIIDRSGGKGFFVTASVIDPFGNILGIMKSIHYLEVLQESGITVSAS